MKAFKRAYETFQESKRRGNSMSLCFRHALIDLIAGDMPIVLNMPILVDPTTICVNYSNDPVPKIGMFCYNQTYIVPKNTQYDDSDYGVINWSSMPAPTTYNNLIFKITDLEK